MYDGTDYELRFEIHILRASGFPAAQPLLVRYAFNYDYRWRAECTFKMVAKQLLDFVDSLGGQWLAIQHYSSLGR